MDGYAATAEIRRREGNGPHTIVIALTAHANQGQRERCLAAGMNGYLSKPVKLQKLAETLDEAARTKGIAEPKPQSGNVGQPDLEELDAAALAELQQLSEATGHNLFHDLVDDFLLDLSGRTQTIKAALDTSDLPGLATQVHPLKSASAIVGARQFAILCSTVEEAARAQNRDKALLLARELLEAAQRLPPVLKRAAAEK
jgi:CheY-like chemotaxis protein